MKGRSSFTAAEAKEIRRLLRLKAAASPPEQKGIRRHLRGIGLYLSDWGASTVADFDRLVARGLIAVGDIAMPPAKSRHRHEAPMHQRLIELLQKSVFPIPSTHDLFNQYSDEDHRVDRPGAAGIRRDNLVGYLTEVLSRAPLLLVGEAAGPWGCHFSGVPFTGEQQILSFPDFPFRGRQSSRDDPPEKVVRRGNGPPYISQSARAFWDVMAPYYHDPGFLVCDLVPLHPHEPDALLSVRTPTVAEIRRFAPVLGEIVRIVDPDTIVAVGRKAEQGLRLLGIDGLYVRHPARGGAAEFARGICRMLGS